MAAANISIIQQFSVHDVPVVAFSGGECMLQQSGLAGAFEKASLLPEEKQARRRAEWWNIRLRMAMVCAIL